MGLILNVAKSIGKEFLANKAADILGHSDKDTPTETAQNDIPVDLSETTSMEDTYEPAVSDANENDPGIVELENYELEPIEDLEDKRNNFEDFYNTWGDWDIFKQSLKSQQDYEQPLDDNTPITIDSNDSDAIPDTDNESVAISQESTQDSTLPQENAPQVENTAIPENTAPLSVPENDIDKQVEEAIESNPTVAEQVTEDVSGEGSPIEIEAEQLNDSNPNNDEVADEAVEQTPVNEKQEILDKLNNAGSSFMNVQSNQEEPLVSGYRREGDKLLDEYGNEIPDYEPIDTKGGVSAERDEDFLGQDEWVDEEGNIHDYSELANGNTEALDKKWYEGDESGEGEYSESGNVNLDYEAAELQDQIKEAEALPVTNAEEAKEKQNKLRALRLRLKEVQTATGHGSNVSSVGPTTDNGIQTTGGRASPRAGIGSIGGSSGHGSMASTSSTKIVDNHNSIASKAPLPHALEDNQGRVISVNGKATTAPSSNNNGAFRSGSFGLMSKASSNLKSIKSKAPVSGGAEHMGTPMTGNGATTGDLSLEDGKQILIERLKQLLTQLTDKEMKQLGFSSNQWNGNAFTELDGYTLQDLIDKVEEYLGRNE